MLLYENVHPSFTIELKWSMFMSAKYLVWKYNRDDLAKILLLYINVHIFSPIHWFWKVPKNFSIEWYKSLHKKSPLLILSGKMIFQKALLRINGMGFFTEYIDKFINLYDVIRSCQIIWNKLARASMTHQLIGAYPPKGPYIVVSFNLQWSYFTTKEIFV